MEATLIAELLKPFLRTPAGQRVALDDTQYEQLSSYLDLLLRWNARINLTAIREPEAIVTRHFGESLFAAAALFGARPTEPLSIIDVGSGAGFPGVPLKIYARPLRVTLIESSQKKSAFLKEATRTLTDIDVFTGRAEQYAGRAPVVTLRAVERFERVLPVAANLVSPGGRLALLIGAPQVERAALLLPSFSWDSPIRIPQSAVRRILIGTNQAG